MRPRARTVLSAMVLGMAGNAMAYIDEADAVPARPDIAPPARPPAPPSVEIPKIPSAAPAPPAKPPAPKGPCPPGMVHIDKFCVDRHEAHLVVVNGSGARDHPHYLRPKKDERYEARSEPGVFPQAYISFDESKSACENAGKRMCTWHEWRRACQGAHWNRYPYGNKRKNGACNVGKAHILGEFYGEDKRQWTHEMFNDPRLNQQAGYLARTGEYDDCVSEEGVYDMVGNVHEWVSGQLSRALMRTLEKEEVRRMKQPYRLGNGVFLGGFYSTMVEHGPGCYFITYAHEQSYHDYSTGFRCCADAVGDDDDVGVKKTAAR